MKGRASLSMRPHSGSGACAPNPRNDRAEILNKMAPMSKLANTTTGEITLGRMWCTARRQGGKEQARHYSWHGVAIAQPDGGLLLLGTGKSAHNRALFVEVPHLR